MLKKGFMPLFLFLHFGLHTTTGFILRKKEKTEAMINSEL